MKPGLALFLAVQIALGSCAVVLADQVEESQECPTIESLLPKDAEICYSEKRDNGKLLCRQRLIFESDLNGDGALETVAFFSVLDRKKDTEELRIAIFEQKPKLRLVQCCQLAGGYVWIDPGTQMPAIWFADIDNDGLIEVYVAHAFGASVGARLSVVYCVKGEKGAKDFYAAQTAKCGFHDIEMKGQRFLVRHKDDKSQTVIVPEKDRDGVLRLRVEKAGSPDTPEF
jgi:hypothetical protein